ncbi:MAG: polyphosphate kinase 2, partial [Azonexus sp.]
MAIRKTTVAGAPVVGVQPKAGTVRARQVAKGDIPPTTTEAGIEGFVVHAAVDGAQESKLGAMRDVLAGLPVDDS